MPKKSDREVYTAADSIMLAEIAVNMTENGVHLRSMSMMLNIVLETYHEWIKKRGATTISTTHEAQEIIRHMFGSSNSRLARQRLRNLQADEPETDFTTDNFKAIVSGKPDPLIQREVNKYLGIKPESTVSQEEMDEYKRRALATNGASIEEKLTPLQISRNKAILAAMTVKIDHHKQEAARYKTDKAKEEHEVAISRIMRLAERAKDDDEALRILIDEA